MQKITKAMIIASGFAVTMAPTVAAHADDTEPIQDEVIEISIDAAEVKYGEATNIKDAEKEKEQTGTVLDEATKNLDEKTDAYNTAQDELDKANDDVTNKETDLDNAKSEAKDKIDNVVADTEKEVEDTDQAVEDAKTDITNKENDVADRTDDVSKAEDTVKDATENLDKVKTDNDNITDDDVKKAEDAYNNAVQEEKDAQDAVTKAEADVNDAKAEVDKIQSDVDAKKAEMETATTDRDAAQKEVETAKADVDVRKQALENAKLTADSPEFRAAQEAYDNALAVLAEKETVRDEKQAVVDKINSDIASKEAEITAAKETLAKKQDGLSVAQNSLTEIQKNLETAKNNVTNANNNVTDKEDTVSNKKDSMDSAKSEADEQTKVVEALQKVLDTKESDVLAKQQALEEAKTALAEAKETQKNEGVGFYRYLESLLNDDGKTIEAKVATVDSALEYLHKKGVSHYGNTSTGHYYAILRESNLLTGFGTTSWAVSVCSYNKDLSGERWIGNVSRGSGDNYYQEYSSSGNITVNGKSVSFDEVDAMSADERHALGIYTTDEMRAALTEYQATVTKAQAAVEAAQKAYDSAVKDRDNAKDNVTAAQTKLNECNEKFTNATNEYNNAVSALTSAKEELSSAQNEVDTASADTAAKKELRDSFNKEVAECEDALALSESTLKEKETTLSEKQAVLDEKTKSYNDAELTLTSAETSLSDMEDVLSDANSVLDSKKSMTSLMGSALSMTKTKRANIVAAETNLETANNNLSDKEQALTDAKNALEIAKQTLTEKEEAAKKAYEKLENSKLVPDYETALASYREGTKIEIEGLEYLNNYLEAIVKAEGVLCESKAKAVEKEQILVDAKEAQTEANENYSVAVLNYNLAKNRYDEILKINQEAEKNNELIQFIDEDGNKYLLYPDGTHYTGWYNMQPYGELYYDPENDGAAVINSIKEIDDKVYLFDENGVAKKTSGTPIVNEEKYWVQSDGSLGSGWLYLGNWKLYFDPETYTAKTVTDGITDINGKKYLFNQDGVMQNFAGTTIVDGKKYWFSTDDASLKTGWLTLGNWKLYFDPNTYACVTGITEIDGNKYLFDSNGILQTSGTPMVNEKKYYIGKDNIIKTGWLYLGNWKMYFDPETCAAAIGIVNIDGKDYLFNKDGVMQNFAGTTIVDGKKYWFSTDDASLKSGWLNLGNMKLYFDPTTYAAYTSTTATIDGIIYEFDSNGCVMQCFVEKDYFKSYEISDKIFSRIYGDDKSFKTYCTVPRSDLRYIKLLHWGFDEKLHEGELIVNKAVAEDIVEIFRELYENKYQIKQMVLVDNYNADDRASIAANNTSAFNFRTVTDNPNVLSYHGMGVAIDINPINNPYVWYDVNGRLKWEDPDAGLYLDRYASDAAKRHMINHNDLCYKLFIQHGWKWGGDWSGTIDYQHFEKTIVNYSL